MKKRMIMAALLLMCVLPIAAQESKVNYATPDMLEQKGPSPEGLDFYFVSAVGKVGVNYVAGDISKFKEKGTVPLTIDVSKVQFGKVNFWEDYREVEDKSEVEEILSRAHSYFRAQFNMKNKKGLTVADEDEDGTLPYNLVIRLRKLNKGNATGFWLEGGVKSGSASIDGTVELIDKQTKEIICVFGFNKIESSNHATKRIRIGLAFGDMGNKLGKLVRDTK